ncbi:hypothetical protein AAUPMB_06288 [Pasteurella multocida subsp. multocida str. Anand1_buffalo]|nr:hypothetical protein AAUPMB_06288 [Pasteurella multocida subsp. multocida str. Anand1_buffalo]
MVKSKNAINVILIAFLENYSFRGKYHNSLSAFKSAGGGLNDGDLS